MGSRILPISGSQGFLAFERSTSPLGINTPPTYNSQDPICSALCAKIATIASQIFVFLASIPTYLCNFAKTITHAVNSFFDDPAYEGRFHDPLSPPRFPAADPALIPPRNDPRIRDEILRLTQIMDNRLDLSHDSSLDLEDPLTHVIMSDPVRDSCLPPQAAHRFDRGSINVYFQRFPRRLCPISQRLIPEDGLSDDPDLQMWIVQWLRARVG